MSTLKYHGIGDACISAFNRVLTECLRFKASELYFVQIELGALRGEEKAAEAHNDFLKILEPEYLLPKDYFLERSFIMLVAAFEYFLQELVHAVVVAHPKKVGRVEFKLSEILDASSTDELVRRSIESTLNSLMYKKPNEYLAEFANLLSIDSKPFKEDWIKFVEAKARRDVGVHNGWRCNETYIRKVTEAGLSANKAIDELLFPPSPGYLDEVREVFGRLANGLIDAVFEKHQALLV